MGCGRSAVRQPDAAAAVAIDAKADEAAAKDCKDIHEAAEEGNVGAVRHFLRVDPESLKTTYGRFGQTALHWAAREGQAAVVEQLISAGATVDAADEDGRTVLHVAAENGQAAVVEQLISAGATVDAATERGETPLHFAAVKGHAAVVEQLISAGATIGRTVLHVAAENGQAAVVEQLISAGATVDAATERGETPLHFAAVKGHAAVVEQLISAGATVDAADGIGDTPYDWAKGRGHRQVMGLLRPVFVALLSGRSCRCNSSPERTVLELKEEAEKKLGVNIKRIIGQNHEPLDESKTLAAAAVVPGNTLTAVIAASEAENEEGPAETEAYSAADPMPEDGVEIKDFPH